MHTIYLVRHCTYDHSRKIYTGRLPVELSEEGKEEAEKIRAYFEKIPAAMIYSSAVLRCKQTSEIIGGGKIPVAYDKRLLEALSAYQGYWRDVDQDSTEYYAHTDELGGESLEDVHTRIVSFAADLLTQPEGNYIVCSHGDPLYLLYFHLLGKPLKHVLRIHPDDWEDYQETGTVRECVVEGGRVVSTRFVVE